MDLDGSIILATPVLPFLIAGIVAAAALLGVGLSIFLSRRKKRPVPLPEARLEAIVNLLGGTANIRSVTASGGRAAFTLFELKKADLEGVRALGASGLFVSGTTVKALFPFDLAGLADRFERKD